MREKGTYNEPLEKEDKRSGKKISWDIKAMIAILLVGAGAFGFYLYMSSDTLPDGEVQEETVKAPSVILGTVEKAGFAEEQEYVGKVETIQAVDIKPQVAGEIVQVHFTEGSIVKAGQLLFTLEGRQYEATIQLRRAELAKAEANYSRAAKFYERLKKADARSVSKADVEQAESDVLQCKADIAQAKAALRLAQIDYEHTKIKAPISGRIGEAIFTKGNHVSPQMDILANIVQVDPIRISFALPDREYIKQHRTKGFAGARIYLPDGSLYPHVAEREFESNRMDSRTGTLTTHFRAKNDEFLLLPGGMVRIVLKPSDIEQRDMIANTAIMTDGGGNFVYVVDDLNVAQQRRVELGGQSENKVAVLSGLEKGERVIVQGVQFVRNGMAVNPISKDTRTTSQARLSTDKGGN